MSACSPSFFSLTWHISSFVRVNFVYIYPPNYHMSDSSGRGLSNEKRSFEPGGTKGKDLPFNSGHLLLIFSRFFLLIFSGNMNNTITSK